MIFLGIKQPEHWQWIRERARCHITLSSKGVIAIDKNGVPCAALVLDSWTPTGGQFHIAVENPMVIRHGFFHAGFRYFYQTCGKLVLTAMTPADNDRALKLAKRVGFRETHRIKDGYNYGVDMVVLEMRKEECKWLHQEVRNADAA